MVTVSPPPSYILHIVCLSAIAFPAQGISQDKASSPGASFDAVSIRRVGSSTVITPMGQPAIGIPDKRDYSPDRLILQLSLDDMIREAFQLKKFELIGPKSLGDEIFLLQATMPLGTSNNDARLMLQQALMERFGLKYNREPRDVSVYALVAAKNGVKLQPADDPAHRQLKSVETSAGTMHAQVSYRPGQFFALAITLDELARQLESFGDLDLPIVDATGLSGEYRIDLHWTPQEQDNGLVTGKDASFTKAVEAQLGLRLEKRKASYDVLVIDQIERMPSAN